MNQKNYNLNMFKNYKNIYYWIYKYILFNNIYFFKFLYLFYRN